MNEFFVVYNLATGAVCWNGNGDVGITAAQQPPEGLAAARVPWQALTNGTLDLELVKPFYHGLVDAAAGQVRSQFITAVPGQELTYSYKAEKARAWLADNTASTKFLEPEATQRGMTIADLAAEVVAREEAWEEIGGKIEGARMGAKDAIAAATDIGAIVTASTVDWTAAIA